MYPGRTAATAFSVVFFGRAVEFLKVLESAALHWSGSVLLQKVWRVPSRS